VATACGACRDCACEVFEESRIKGGARATRSIAIVPSSRLAA
jgi:bacterioferritin-associated ferredoxin